jgi:hypothetical protein
LIQDDLYYLPVEKLQIKEETKITAIADIAGRDSIAAILKFSDNRLFQELQPLTVYVPVDPLSIAIRSNIVMRLKEVLRNQGNLRPLIAIGDLELWRTLNAQYVSLLEKKFGFYTPCIGCHLYINTLKILVARAFNTSLTISGERESHDKKLKINQLPKVLDLMNDFMSKYKIINLQPLRKIVNNSEVELILHTAGFKRNISGTCIFRDNYRGANFKIIPDLKAVIKFLKQFAFPIAKAS